MSLHWNTRYLPPDPGQWQGRSDTPANSCFFQVIKMLNLLEQTIPELDTPAFALIGFKSDEGVRRNLGRIGAAEGPQAIRQMLARLPVQKQNFVCFDVGTIFCDDNNLEASQESFSQVIELLLQHHITPIALGGGHEIAWGHYQGIAHALTKSTLGIINFDAHFDMRAMQHNKSTSGTPFLQIARAHEEQQRRFDYNCLGIQTASNIHALFETAKTTNTKFILADEFHQGQTQKCVDFIDRVVDENDFIYVSICLDVFAACVAAGVSAPQPLGLFPWHVIPLVRQLAACGKVLSYDIAELCPRYDIDHCTAKLAANLIYEIIHHHHSLTRPL